MKFATVMVAEKATRLVLLREQDALDLERADFCGLLELISAGDRGLAVLRSWLPAALDLSEACTVLSAHRSIERVCERVTWLDESGKRSKGPTLDQPLAKCCGA